MEPWVVELKKKIEGAVITDTATRHRVSHDASIYELVPDMVVQPAHAADIETLVQLVTKHKKLYPKLAITPRSAGTDMSGGSLGSSIVIEMTPHFSTIHSIKNDVLHVQPGVYLRDIDPLLAQKNLQLGCAPASRRLCTIGGVVANNAGGEQSLRYGNANRTVKELSVVLADGKTHTIRPLTKKQLDKKMRESSYEASLYKQIYELIEHNYDLIKNARPKVNKNSMGYNLWDVWDRDTGIFDMTQLFSGSQGTLGIITDIHMQAVPKAPYSGLLLIYLASQKKLGKVIEAVIEHEPATFEGFDDITFSLGVKHFKTFRKQLGLKEYLRQQASLAASVARLKGRSPKMFLMVGIDGVSQQEVSHKLAALQESLTKYRVHTEIKDTETSSAPFWSIRRASLSLLQHHVRGRYASPFIDDMTVEPRFITKFLPELRRVIRKYKLPVTIQGHFGDGNFHIIPLMDIKTTSEQNKLEPAMRELLPIVKKYGGSMAGEHNDGLIRGPWLPAMFGNEMYHIFKQVKEIFDPLYIFNPHKKTDASWDYSMSHIRTTTHHRLIK